MHKTTILSLRKGAYIEMPEHRITRKIIGPVGLNKDVMDPNEEFRMLNREGLVL
jgi:hypothetical protein